MASPSIVAFVMAGGEGTRLRPFTNEVPKPALPIGNHRIIDFVLSNLYNSGIRSTFVLLQYKPQVLIEHLREVWQGDGGADFDDYVIPLMPTGTFEGTADAVRKSLAHLDGVRADVVAVFAADHVYRMDVRQMAAFHLAQQADVTIAALPVPVERAAEFGVIEAHASGRIAGFHEKPRVPAPMPGDRNRAYVSMGNYLFRPDVLRSALAAAAEAGHHDFGRHVLPRLLHSHHVFAYDFRRNLVPGLKPGEEAAYWRDIGTVAAYAEARRDLQGLQPLLAVDNPAWPIRSRSTLIAAQAARTADSAAAPLDAIWQRPARSSSARPHAG